MPSIRERLQTDLVLYRQFKELKESLERPVCMRHGEYEPCTACESLERQRRADLDEAWEMWEAMGREDDLDDLAF